MHKHTQAVLELLKNAPSHISGQEVSARFGISRNAIWKHIQTLREQGYVINSAPKKGYQLIECPDALLACEVQPGLKTESFGRIYKMLESTESTNRVAGRMAADGAPEGTTVAADCQTAGRGRLGRTWHSPPGKNIYVSVVLRPAIPAIRAAQLSLIIALSVARVLRAAPYSVPVLIKWPNDLYLEGRKLSGILCDMEAEPEQIHHMIAGLGLNVNVQKNEMPPEVAERAISLREATSQFQRRAPLLAAILNEFEQTYTAWLNSGGLEPFQAELADLSFLQNRTVTVQTGAGSTTGQVSGIAENGALLLRDTNGTEHRILAGDVHVESF